MHVLITRPIDQARSTVQSVKDLGYDAIVDPLLRIEPQTVDLGDLDPAAFIVTSANAAHAIPERFHGRPVFAVGTATARACERAGCTHVIEGPGNASYLLPIIKQFGDLGDGPIIYLAGDHVRVELDLALREDGYTAERFLAYKSVAVTRLSDITVRAIEDETLDVVTFFSPRSAQIFVDIIHEEGLEEFIEPVGAICLSPVVARAAAHLRWRRVLISPGRTQSALLACLERLRR